MRLWDRSRWEAHAQCPHRRYMEYDFLGTGIRTAGHPVARLTGTQIHEAMDKMLHVLVQTPGGDVDGVISTVSREYEEGARAGFLDSDINEGVQEFIVAEQKWLVECLAWGVFGVFIPWLMENFEILTVEQEETFVVGCDCGLGDGVGEVSWMDGLLVHEGRPCSGIVIMSRPDFVTRRRSDGSLGIWDWKTTSGGLYMADEDYKVQMMVGSKGVEGRFGEAVSHYYIVGLRKGRREFLTKEERESGGVKKQNSSLCYPWVERADPPFNQKQISFEKKSGQFRRPAWTLGFTAKEWMMEQVPLHVVESHIENPGPQTISPKLLETFFQQVVGLEREWATRLEHLAAGVDRSSLIFQTWNCKPYGRDYPCVFLDSCKGLVYEEALVKSGRFIKRVANHELEKGV